MKKMTTRQANAALRSLELGGIETTDELQLLDGTTVAVELTPAYEAGCYLIGSQRIVRRDDQKRVIRTYAY